jgi:hypothetical protein
MKHERDWSMAKTKEADIPPNKFGAVLSQERTVILSARADSTKASLEISGAGFVGLALSGGGIRAATFSLGVLQALANAGKLSAFDYLSTVSGGGYIGCWLSAWIHRKGLDVVEAELKSRVATGGRPAEPPEVTWLRRYSNYLAPKLGLLSADTMTLIATWTRNVLLNLVILISLLAFAFILPRVLLDPAMHAIAHHSDEYGYAAAWVGFFLFPAAISFNLSRVAAVDSVGRINWVTTTQGVFATVIIPGVLATLLASLTLFSPHSTVRDHLAGLAVGVLTLLALPGALWVAYQLTMKERPWTIVKEAGIFLLAYVAALLVGYLLVEAFIEIVYPVGCTPALTASDAKACELERAANILTFGPPALLVTFGISGSVVVGLVGRVYYERSREWWGRMNAWFVTLGITWLVFFGLAFYTIPLVEWAGRMSGTWVKALAGAGWLGSLATTLLVPKPGNSKTVLSRFGSRALDMAAGVVVIGFFVAVAYGTSATLHALTDAKGAPAVEQTSKLTEVALKVSVDGKASQSAMWFTENRDAKITPFVVAAFRDERTISEHRIAFADGLCPWTSGAPGSFCQMVKPSVPQDLTFISALGCLLVFLVFGWRVDVNKFSLHNLYKNRLVRCYLGASRQNDRFAQPFTGFDEEDDIALSHLRREVQRPNMSVRPLHIINAALNITHGTNLAWQERKAASFTFTAWQCGYSLGPSAGDTPPAPTATQLPLQPSAQTRNPQRVTAEPPVQAYRDTAKYASERDEDRELTLGSAMATSGAAVSPNMGRASTPALAFVMTLFNVRLGRWSPNPNRKKWKQSSPSYGLVCLVQELFGFANESRNFVQLSDGGHFDNTGIYELVHRQCLTIVAVDAGADFGRSFADLANAVRKCRVDFGFNIDIDLNAFGTTRPEESKSEGYAVGTIDYGGGRIGRLIVIKPTLLALQKLGVDIFGYSRLQELFPQQSTADQFFDESQFESYRALGECIATKCLADKECHLPQKLA